MRGRTMKTPAEIKEWLAGCVDKSCCRFCYRESACEKNLKALAYIQQLESELKAVKLERDAAVKDLTEGRRCHSCKHIGRRFEGPCRECMSGHGYERNHYEWRGVCPENTEEKK